MFRSKKEVDRHVEQLEAKILAESERNLKAFTIAKLYVNVGEYETARKYLAKYISVRENSASAFKLNGQVKTPTELSEIYILFLKSGAKNDIIPAFRSFTYYFKHAL